MDRRRKNHPFSTSIVWVTESSSLPYHAMKRAWQLSQWISNVRSRLGAGRAAGRYSNLILSVAAIALRQG
jgi:hypothetical protein